MTDQTDPLADAIEAAIWAGYPDAEPTDVGLVLANPRRIAAAAASAARAAVSSAVPAPATTVAGCLFCQPDGPDNRIIGRHGAAYARLDNYPVTDGHFEILPVRHVESALDLTPAEVLDMHTLLQQLTQAAGVDGYTIGINEGQAAGRTIDHAHLHVIPRRYGDVPDPRGGVRGVLPGVGADAWDGGRAPATDQAALREQLAAAVRSITVVGGAPPRRLVPVIDGSNPRMARIVDWQPLDDFLDALAAVLPAPTDRAVVLLWAADQIDAETQQAKADGVLEPDKFRPCRDASAQLRHLAAEPATDKPADDQTRRACPGYETAPNRCSCGCEGCKHNCAAHHAPDAQQDQRPRCPHCQTPHDLTPSMILACQSIRASIAQRSEAQQDPAQDGEALPSSTAPLASGLPLVKGNCPACRRASLFLGTGGYPTCANADCTEPDAATTVLEQYANEAHPPQHAWRVETRDPLANQWAPGSHFRSRPHAVERYETANQNAPLWRDGTPVERRIVRETTTYTVEAEHSPAAVARPGQPDTDTQPAGTTQQTREA